MALRNDLSAEVKSDLVNYSSAIDGQGYILLGESAAGDHPARIYFYESSSTATVDGENVLAATGMGGTGRFLKNPVESVNPTGVIQMWGASSAPSGWLLCDGSAISRTTYAPLFSIVGTTYGMGDGSTTFNLPDMRQRFPLGLATSGTGSALGGTGGIIDHAHGSPITSGTPSATVSNVSLLGIGAAASDTHTHNVTLTAQNPPFQVFNFIIKI